MWTGLDWMDGSLNGVTIRAPNGANNGAKKVLDHGNEFYKGREAQILNGWVGENGITSRVIEVPMDCSMGNSAW